MVLPSTKSEKIYQPIHENADSVNANLLEREGHDFAAQVSGTKQDQSGRDLDSQSLTGSVGRGSKGIGDSNYLPFFCDRYMEW